jgi:hypothetical protein
MVNMDINGLIATLDAEIATLQQVKRLLVGTDGVGPQLGRPEASSFSFGNKPRKKRVMSAAAKTKIREAQQKRWAAWHKIHLKKAAAKK